jgi:Protein of unknown function (DUF2778)
MFAHRSLIQHIVPGLILLVSAMSVYAENITMPPGWRAPTDLELNDV